MRCIASVLFLMMALSFSACKQHALNGNEYVAFVENEKNDMVRTKQVEDLNFRVQYCPAEYLLLKELKTDRISAAELAQRKKDNEGMHFFRLRIRTNDGLDVLKYKASEADAYARTQYLSYDFEQDIALVSGSDTIFPAVFHFERTYGVTPFADFMLGFEANVKAGSDFQLLIDDKVFDTGVLKFTYNDKDIQNLPPLKTN